MSPAQRPERPPNVHNEAGGHATIGVQGVVYGDVRYEVKNEDPPWRKFEVAKNCLAGGMPRRAEQLIKDVFEIGFPSPGSALANEVAYHWVIAVLGDQSFELLGDEQFGDIGRARTLAANGPADEWQQALGVLLELVDCLKQQELTGQDNPERLGGCFRDFDRLPNDRREEILRHLKLILTGATQDYSDSRFAEVVRLERMGDGRVDRVWKFFEPVPAEPRPIRVREPSLKMLKATAALGGALLSGAAVILSIVLLTQISTKAAAIVGVLVIVGCGLLAISVPSYFPKRYSAYAPQNPGHEDPDFDAQIRAAVRRLFRRRAPQDQSDGPWQRPGWHVATGLFQSRIADEIIDLYCEPKIEPGAIDWLIDWYARNWYASKNTHLWKSREFKEARRVVKWLGLIPGAAILVLTGFYTFTQIRALEPKITMVAVGWLLCGALLLALVEADVFLWSRVTFHRNKTVAETRNREEKEAYVARCELLVDRPDDADMVRWLDYDKFYLKRLAMNQYGLANRDVIAHAILTEATPNARRARFSNGPPRFSDYHIWIFLLTPDGVRQIAVRLDFPTGIARDQRRIQFRYDVIAAARVTEFGLRFDDGRREIILPRADRANGVEQADHDNDDAAGDTGDDGEKVRRDAARSSFILFQEFRLSLISGEEITITVEDLDKWILQDNQDQVPDNSEPESTDQYR